MSPLVVKESCARNIYESFKASRTFITVEPFIGKDLGINLLFLSITLPTLYNSVSTLEDSKCKQLTTQGRSLKTVENKLTFIKQPTCHVFDLMERKQSL